MYWAEASFLENPTSFFRRGKQLSLSTDAFGIVMTASISNGQEATRNSGKKNSKVTSSEISV